LSEGGRGSRLFALFYWTTVVVGALAAILLIMYFASRFAQDTIAVSNVAFGTVAALASLTLTLAQLFDPVEERPERIQLRDAGEHLLHGASLFLVASLLKYAGITGDPWALLTPDARIKDVLMLLALFATFVGSALAAWGLVILHVVLFMRMRSS
jgi:hypothetical protein